MAASECICVFVYEQTLITVRNPVSGAQVNGGSQDTLVPTLRTGKAEAKKAAVIPFGQVLVNNLDAV